MSTRAASAAATARVVTRRYAPRTARPIPVIARGGDPWLLASMIALIALSVVMVFNTSYFFAAERFADPYHVFRKHLVSIALGALCCAGASRLSSRAQERIGALRDA